MPRKKKNKTIEVDPVEIPPEPSQGVTVVEKNLFPQHNDFIRDVQKQVAERKCTFLEAVIEMCEKYEVEPEFVASYLPQPIKEHIRSEAADIHLLPRGTSLPLGDMCADAD